MRIILATLLCLPAQAQNDAGWRFEADLRLGEKYDDNLDLSSQEDPTAEPEADFLTELGFGGRMAHTFKRWEVDIALRLRGDLPNTRPKRARLYTGTEAYFGLRIAPEHTLSISEQGDCFVEPQDTAFSVCRSFKSMAWAWAFAERWQLRLGVEHNDAIYFADRDLSYDSGGPFLELRMPWSYAFTAWIRGAFIAYHGAFRAQTGDREGGPTEGARGGAELGIDWSLGHGVSLLATAQIQLDQSDSDLLEVGRSDLQDQSLESDAEFNFRKARGTFLASWRLNPTFDTGLYGEFIRIAFLESPLRDAGGPDRLDLRWMASAWLGMKLDDSGLGAKLRYLIRRNHSTVDAEDYQNQILYLGLEQRW